MSDGSRESAAIVLGIVGYSVQFAECCNANCGGHLGLISTVEIRRRTALLRAHIQSLVLFLFTIRSSRL